jgi:hypothetical protein
MFLPAKRSIARFLLARLACNASPDFIQPNLQDTASKCFASAKAGAIPQKSPGLARVIRLVAVFD